MKPDERAHLRALEKAATPGPWDWRDDDNEPVYAVVSRLLDGRHLDLARFRVWEENDDADARLTVAMRNALPQLLDAADECDRLREVVEAAQECHWSPPDGSDVGCRLCAALARLEKGAGE